MTATAAGFTARTVGVLRLTASADRVSALPAEGRSVREIAELAG